MPRAAAPRNTTKSALAGGCYDGAAMNQDNASKAAAGAAEDKALRKAQAERRTRMMWAYICGAIALLSFVVGLGASFIPLGFGVLGSILAWQLLQSGERRHSTLAGTLALAAIMIWLSYNWPMIQRYAGG
jgi:thiol:disulfide interchange protein